MDRSRQHLRLALAALGVAAVSILVAAGIRLWTYSLGFRSTHPLYGFRFAFVEQMAGSLRLLLEDVLLLSNGYFPGSTLNPRTLLELAIGTATFGALALPPILLLRQLANARSANVAAPTKLAFLVFWVTIELATIAQFLLSSIVVGSGVASVRFLIPLFYVLAAIVPVWAVERGWRRAITLGSAAAFCLLGIVAVHGGRAPRPLGPYHLEATPLVREGPDIVEFLQERGVRYGYSAWLHSHPLTYQSNLKVLVTPVRECGTPPRALCRNWVNTRSDWYGSAPRPTFLLVDRLPTLYESEYLHAPPWDDLGLPAEVHEFEGFLVYLYDYDIGSRILPFKV